MDPRRMIIDRPELQSRGSKIGFGIVTFVFWAIWIYLWLPLVTAFAWYAGITEVHEELFEFDGFQGLRSVMGLYLTVLELIIVVFLGWSLYNQYRYGRRSARRLVRKTNYQEMCRTFGLSRDGLVGLRRAKIATVDYDLGASTLVLQTRGAEEVMAPELSQPAHEPGGATGK